MNDKVPGVLDSSRYTYALPLPIISARSPPHDPSGRVLDGKQYIALAAANSTSTPRYLPRLYVFTLDGRAPLP
jgi:hypothetical protein